MKITLHSFGSLWTGPPTDPHRYRVDLGQRGLEPVGDGGEGLVFRASTAVDGATVEVALKMLTTLTLADYPTLAERAAALRSISHPHVMRLLEVFVGSPLVAEAVTPLDEFEILYTAAEWVPGSSLESGVQEVGPGTALLWIEQIAFAVHYLHQFRGPGAPDGFVHRDIKPSNVRITPDGRAVLIDFGVTRPHIPGDQTQGVGTYLWKAPEVVGGPGSPGKASDIWGIGALAYWAIVGEPPRLEGAEMSAAKVHQAAGAHGFPNPEGLAAHIGALLEIHPERRPTDMAVWATQLRAIATGRKRRATGRNMLRVGGLAGLAAVLVVGAVLAGWAISGHYSQRGLALGTATTTTTVKHSVSLGHVSTSTTDPISPSALATKRAMDGSGTAKGTQDTSSSPTTAGDGLSASGGTATGGAPTTSTPPADTSTTVQGSALPATSPPTTAGSPGPVSTSTTAAAATHTETSGGVVHTWTDYSDAGGEEGLSIPGYATVQIQCRVQGFTVQDGNTWWYRIASTPWSGAYYGSADAFYNDGSTSGSLEGTPFVDPSVPEC